MYRRSFLKHSCLKVFPDPSPQFRDEVKDEWLLIIQEKNILDTDYQLEKTRLGGRRTLSILYCLQEEEK